MSVHAHDEFEGSVTSVRGFLADMLDTAIAIDRQLHDNIHSLRERVHALDLAEDPDFRATVGTLRDRLAADPTLGERGLTADEFAAKYLVG